MRLILATLSIFGTAVLATAQPYVPTQYILYKSGAQYLPPNPAMAWSEPSNAYTAITIPMPFDQWKAAGLTIQDANVQVVWKANSALFNTGVGLFVCPAQAQAGVQMGGCTMLVYFAANDTQGPASYTPGCSSNPGGPMPCRADVAVSLKNYLTNGAKGLYLAVLTYGNGTVGPLVWDAEMFVNWQ